MEWNTPFAPDHIYICLFTRTHPVVLKRSNYIPAPNLLQFHFRPWLKNNSDISLPLSRAFDTLVILKHVCCSRAIKLRHLHFLLVASISKTSNGSQKAVYHDPHALESTLLQWLGISQVNKGLWAFRMPISSVTLYKRLLTVPRPPFIQSIE